MAGFTSGQAVTEERLTELMSGERGEPLKPDISTGAKIFAGIAALAQRERGLEQVFVHGDSHGGYVYQTHVGVGR